MASEEPKIGIASEKHFAHLCYSAGVISHEPDNDQNGWDLFLEFPDAKWSGAEDEKPIHKTAYVQVKSTIQDKAAVRELTLSNARKMSSSDDPWFLVLYHWHNEDTYTIYVKHVWEEFIEDALNGVRRADVAGIKLNSKNMQVSFSSQDDHGQDKSVLKWMEEVIHSIGNDYKYQKNEIFKNVGREESDGYGTIKFATENQEDIDKAFLGLGRIEIDSFSFVPSRFGIPDERRKETYNGGFLTITPSQGFDSSIIYKEVGSSLPHFITGKAYWNSHSNAKIQCRVEASYLNLLVKAGGGLIVNIGYPAEISYSMNEFISLCKFLDLFFNKGINLTVYLEKNLISNRNIVSNQQTTDIYKDIVSGASRWIAYVNDSIKLKNFEFHAFSKQLVMLDRCLSDNAFKIVGGKRS